MVTNSFLLIELLTFGTISQVMLLMQVVLIPLKIRLMPILGT